MARSYEQDHVDIVSADEDVEMSIDKCESWTRPPVPSFSVSKDPWKRMR
jgi:hypothetical protein